MNLLNRPTTSRAQFVRNALSTGCIAALLITVGTAVSADRAGSRLDRAEGKSGVESRAPYAQGIASTVQNNAYPDTETMLQMYHAARKDGRLDPSMSTEYPTLPILKAAYRLLTEPGARRAPLQGEALGQPNASALIPTKAATCRSATLNCLVTAGQYGVDGNFSTLEWARLFSCSMAAAGRNQDSPQISSDCTDILAGSSACATANSLCGVVAQPLPTDSTFVGTSTNYYSTLTCGNLASGIAKDRIIRLGVERRTILGVERITRMYFKCTSNTSTWLGTANTGGTQVFMSCPSNTASPTAIEGAKMTKLDAGGLRSLKLRCDDIDSADPAGGYYATVISNTAGAGTEYRAECDEGYYVWGIRVYRNGGAPADQQYITGYNYLCRK